MIAHDTPRVSQFTEVIHVRDVGLRADQGWDIVWPGVAALIVLSHFDMVTGRWESAIGPIASSGRRPWTDTDRATA